MRQFLFILALIPNLTFAADLRLDELELKLDAFVKTYQPVEDTGIAVGIVKDGELVFFKGYGYRDRDRKLPVTPKTIFAIGSITKTFIATSLAMLQEEGKVSFQEPVRSYLPYLALDTAEATEKANLEDLLSHQTGLPRHDMIWYLTSLSPAQLVRRLQYLESNKAEGFQFRSGITQYNNLMFTTSGLLIQKQSGRSWQEFVRERITGPLGMNDTSFDTGGFEREDSALGYGRLVVEKDRPQAVLLPYKDLGAGAAAGAMNSNVDDLVRYVNFHLRGGKGLISASSMENLYQRRSDFPPNRSGVEMSYGLGHMLAKVNGKQVIFHGGNIDGFSTMVSFSPEMNLGVIVLVNQNGGTNFQIPVKVKQGEESIPLFPYIIYDHFSAGSTDLPKLGKMEMENLTAHLALPEMPRLAVSTASFLLPVGDFLGGSFEHPGYGTISLVNVYDGSLSLNYYGNVLPLTATAEPGKYFIENGDEDMPVELEYGAGRVIAVKVGFEKAVSLIRFAEISLLQM